MIKEKVILEGIVGSKAYGLDTPESDTDIKGIFIYPTEKILSFDKGKQTYNKQTEGSISDDVEYHEVEKFMSLAMKCNPTILEMLFLDEYTQLTKEGEFLISLRKYFLSNTVFKSYGGYALAQAKKLYIKAQSGNQHTRHEKHARHCFRLLLQGEQLLKTGTLRVKLDVKERYQLFEISKMSVDDMINLFEDKFKEFDKIESILPDKPDYEKLNELLLYMRYKNLKG